LNMLIKILRLHHHHRRHLKTSAPAAPPSSPSPFDQLSPVSSMNLADDEGHDEDANVDDRTTPSDRLKDDDVVMSPSMDFTSVLTDLLMAKEEEGARVPTLPEVVLTLARESHKCRNHWVITEAKKYV
jgi:hypothetical protein